MLQVTCPGTCQQQFNETVCTGFLACQWLNTSATCEPVKNEATSSTTYIGVILSLVGNIIINAGMNSMRHAHVTNRDPATGDPIQEFWRIPWWWFGIIGIVGGEVGNLVAYGYAPASIVTPIGAVGVLTNVLITTLVLKEQVRKLNILGMAAVVCGIVVTVYFAPKANVHFASDTFWADVIATQHGIIYFGIFALFILLMFPINKYFGTKSVVIAVFTSSIYGSLTILSAKTFSSLLTKAFDEGFDAYFLSPVPYLAFLVMVITCVITMSYINTAMKHFGNSQVVPTYYALFTTMSVASVGFVFREFDCLTEVRDAILFVAGIVLAMCGVSLVQLLPASMRVAIQPVREEDMVDSCSKGDLQSNEGITPAAATAKPAAADSKALPSTIPVAEAVPVVTVPAGQSTAVANISAPPPKDSHVPDASRPAAPAAAQDGGAARPPRLPPLLEKPLANGANGAHSPNGTAGDATHGRDSAAIAVYHREAVEPVAGGGRSGTTAQESPVQTAGRGESSLDATLTPARPARRLAALKPLPPRPLPSPSAAPPPPQR